ncbi:hypothetical protein DFP72DRAFT_1076201 [Ephemerocybe angulata]|uniref:Uncharacterized protein n=1 Tax=Ephemerocybe angulata TaxID=980116 RepID=A0A8H6LZX3_9AGAR|nr:hypothetical protein DFP72DRAFT_1076201 [Tulosesus angulatus]
MKSIIFSTVGVLAFASAALAGRICETSAGSPWVQDATFAITRSWRIGNENGKTLVCQTNSGGGCIVLGTYADGRVAFCSSQASCQTIDDIEEKLRDVINNCAQNGKVGGKWVFGDGAHADVFHS